MEGLASEKESLMMNVLSTRQFTETSGDANFGVAKTAWTLKPKCEFEFQLLLYLTSHEFIGPFLKLTSFS